MDTQVEDILDKILHAYPQDVFTKNIEFIRKTNANLENVDTIQSIKTLAILLEVLGNAELALQTSSIIDKIEFTGDMLIWEKVRDVLILEYFIYQERKEFQKAKAIMYKMTLVFGRGDEAQQRKSKRILDRVLNGSLLHTEEIENAIKSQLKLSKITDSKKVNLKMQKAIKVPDNIAKFLNLLPNPSNWWRAITK